MFQFLPSEIRDGGDRDNQLVFERKEIVGAQVSDGERFFQITTFCCLTLHDEQALPLLEGVTQYKHCPWQKILVA